MAKGKSPRTPKPPPVCKAILLCDQVIRDVITGKASLIGIVEGFVMELPGHTLPVTAFVQLIEGVGTYVLSVEVHDLQANEVIARATAAEVTFQNRLDKKEIVIPVPALPVDHPGAYDFVVLADDKEVDRQQFQVHIPPEEDRDEEQEAEDTGG